MLLDFYLKTLQYLITPDKTKRKKIVFTFFLKKQKQMINI